jgi:hypothetical protein
MHAHCSPPSSIVPLGVRAGEEDNVPRQVRPAGAGRATRHLPHDRGLAGVPGVSNHDDTVRPSDPGSRTAPRCASAANRIWEEETRDPDEKVIQVQINTDAYSNLERRATTSDTQTR